MVEPLLVITRKNTLWYLFMYGMCTTKCCKPTAREVSKFQHFKVGTVLNRFKKPILKMNSTRKGSLKLTIGSIIGSANRFRCHKSEKLPKTFVGWCIINIWHNCEFVSFYSKNFVCFVLLTSILITILWNFKDSSYSFDHE